MESPMNPNETYSLLLRPDFWDQVEHRFGHSLPPNLADALIARLCDGSPATKELRAIAHEIIDHLEGDRPGWGDWPDNLGDAMAIGIILGLWMKCKAANLVEELSEEELAEVEAECRELGFSLEQLLIGRLEEKKAHEGDER
jgi:hypothetical protein